MRFRKVIPILVLVLVVAMAGLFLGGVLRLPTAGGGSGSAAPGFTVTDIYGHNFTLTNYRNTSVVVIEFTSLSCSECQVVEKSIQSLYTTYNETGTTKVHVLSVYIEPQFGDTVPALKAYHTKNNITWTMAQDTSSLAISRAYGVSDIPTVFVIDKHEQTVYDVSGVQSTSQLASTINSAEAGTATAISFVVPATFALAAVAGVTTFFSPCAFPMFPGYMGLFLGLNTGTTESQPTSGTTYKGALRRALSAGSVTALGMVIVFLIIGLALILAASVVSGYIPDLMVVVGSVLIVLGALLLTNLQYWRVVAPIQRLWQRMRGVDANAAVAVTPTASSGKGFYLKLFSYGMGYAAAAAGCVAPVIFSAIIAGIALGLLGGIASILIYSATAALLMIVVTVALAMAGKKYVNQLKAFTPVIKKVSAVVLVLVGVYLLYFFYTAWIA